MSTFRVFTIGGLISYRALFNWMAPGQYIPTMLAGPLFQILFFTYLGRFAATKSDAFFIIGNGIQVCAMSAVFGMALTVGGERWTQTLGSILATPANRAALFLGRALPNIVNGVFVSAFGLIISSALLDYEPAAGAVPAIAFLVLLCTITCSAFGLAVGALGLRFRDVFMIANPAYFLMLLLCGVNVPLDGLPDWMATIGSGLPLTHGIAAARDVAAGASLADVSTLVWKEAAVGVAWAIVAYGMIRFFELEGRRRATLETM
jgi:ABC-2 type transport system permease protein